MRVHGKPLYRGDCLKRGLGQFKGALVKKKGVVFLRGVDTPMHIMVIHLTVVRGC